MRLNKSSKELRLTHLGRVPAMLQATPPGRPVMTRGQLGLLFKIASLTIGL